MTSENGNFTVKMRVFLKQVVNYYRKHVLLKRFTVMVLFLLGLYLVLYPLVPGLVFKLFYEDKEVYPYKTKVQEKITEDLNSESGEEIVFENREIPEDNRLVLPTINVDMPIVEGEEDWALDLGLWHRPETGNPGTGNMVITGHRVGYQFLPEDVRNSTSFYNLDKLQNGDLVIVYWEGVEYDYEIDDYEVVESTDMYIEDQDGKERLTLYTCHPLGSNSHRLVYYAKPMSV